MFLGAKLGDEYETLKRFSLTLRSLWGLVVS